MSKILKMLKIKIKQSYNYIAEIQYGKELKEVITNNRIIYAMNILERQSEICAHDKKANQLTVTKQFNARNDNKIIRKKITDTGIKSYAK